MSIVNPPFNIRRTATKRGFSLIETLVAITLLVMAIVGPLTLSSKSFEASSYANNQITAQYLAQEGIEVIRHVRDNNAFQGQYWLSGLTDCIGARCTVDSWSETFTVCQGICPVLYVIPDLSIYRQDVGIEASRFRREVEIGLLTELDGNGNPYEMRATSTVYWRNVGSAKEKSITVVADFYNWKGGEQ